MTTFLKAIRRSDGEARTVEVEYNLDVIKLDFDTPDFISPSDERHVVKEIGAKTAFEFWAAVIEPFDAIGGSAEFVVDLYPRGDQGVTPMEFVDDFGQSNSFGNVDTFGACETQPSHQSTSGLAKNLRRRGVAIEDCDLTATIFPNGGPCTVGSMRLFIQTYKFK